MSDDFKWPIVEDYRGYKITTDGGLFGIEPYGSRDSFVYSDVQGARGAVDAILSYLAEDLDGSSD